MDHGAAEAAAHYLVRLVWDEQDQDRHIMERLADDGRRSHVGHELRYLRAFAIDFLGHRWLTESARDAIFDIYHSRWDQWGETDYVCRWWVSGLRPALLAYTDAVKSIEGIEIILPVRETFAIRCLKDDGAECESDLSLYGACVFVAHLKVVKEYLREVLSPLPYKQAPFPSDAVTELATKVEEVATFSCRSSACGQLLRVPRNRGRLRVTCPSCGAVQGFDPANTSD